MAGKKLTANVLLEHPETGEVVTFLAGDAPESWAVPLIGEHCYAEPETDPVAEEVAAKPAAKPAAKSTK